MSADNPPETARPILGTVAEYEQRGCAICGARYPGFGFGPPQLARQLGNDALLFMPVGARAGMLQRRRCRIVNVTTHQIPSVSRFAIRRSGGSGLAPINRTLEGATRVPSHCRNLAVKAPSMARADLPATNARQIAGGDLAGLLKLGDRLN
jgi:hypothetical protein